MHATATDQGVRSRITFANHVPQGLTGDAELAGQARIGRQFLAVNYANVPERFLHE